MRFTSRWFFDTSLANERRSKGYIVCPQDPGLKSHAAGGRESLFTMT